MLASTSKVKHLTLSILFPTTILTMFDLVEYVSNSESQVSNLENVAWDVTSYTNIAPWASR